MALHLYYGDDLYADDMQDLYDELAQPTKKPKLEKPDPDLMKQTIQNLIPVLKKNVELSNKFKEWTRVIIKGTFNTKTFPYTRA